MKELQEQLDNINNSFNKAKHNRAIFKAISISENDSPELNN